jgi:hypothetical protein
MIVLLPQLAARPGSQDIQNVWLNFVKITNISSQQLVCARALYPLSPSLLSCTFAEKDAAQSSKRHAAMGTYIFIMNRKSVIS